MRFYHKFYQRTAATTAAAAATKKVPFRWCRAAGASSSSSRGGDPVTVAGTAASSSRSRAFTKTGPRKPQSPRPEQYPNEQKLEDLAVKKRNIKYDPEYADDIARAKRRLFDLRMRKSQRLPFKSSEFRELRRFVARLKTQQREDELRAAGVDLKKKKPRTRRERQRTAEKRARQLAQKARNRERYGMEELVVADDAL